MNSITKAEERRESELGLNDGNGGAKLPGFITKDDLLQNYLVTQASSVAIDSPSTAQTGKKETKNPLLPSTSFPIAQSHENDQLEPRIEDSNNSGFPVINYPSSLNPFAQECVALSTPKNAERTSLPIAQCKQSTTNSMGLRSKRKFSEPNNLRRPRTVSWPDDSALRGSRCRYPNQKLSKEIFYIILHGGNPLTPLWEKNRQSISVPLLPWKIYSRRSQGSNKRPSYLGTRERLPRS